MNVQPEMVKLAQRLKDEGKSMEIILQALREQRCSPFDSLKVLMQVTGMSLTEAKRVIDTSETWRDHREHFRALDEGASAALADEVREGKGKRSYFFDQDLTDHDP
jgi:hypothetical protein